MRNEGRKTSLIGEPMGGAGAVRCPLTSMRLGDQYKLRATLLTLDLPQLKRIGIGKLKMDVANSRVRAARCSA